jgi:egghead protein (zeste-white 4 protein)
MQKLRNPASPTPILTLQSYNKAIRGQLNTKNLRIGSLLALTTATSMLATEWPKILTSLDLAANAAKVSWLLPIPYFILQAAGFQSGLNSGLLIDLDSLKEKRTDLLGKRIIYTITTKGENLATLEETVDSTLKWTRSVKTRHGLRFDSEVWVVTEEPNYDANAAFYNRLEEKGAIVVAVPSAYQTRNLSMFKTRALQYASELRSDRGLDGPTDWVYHQDTETQIGEDTVLGNIDFILNADDATKAGSGIILYSEGWSQGYTSVQETARSSADLCAAGQMNSWGRVIFGYHGSHILIRGDAEAELGWDYGRVRSEDLLFNIKLRKKYGGCIRSMKGFAYEKPPLTLRDHLKQRRRWILGSFEILKRKDVSLRMKIPIIYSAVSWLSALPSLAITAFNMVYPSGGFIPLVSGVCTGLVWWSMLNGYLVGLELHKDYARVKGGILGVIKGILTGLAADAISPWYALLFNTKGYDEISKDAPRETPDEEIVDAVTYASGGSNSSSWLSESGIE